MLLIYIKLLMTAVFWGGTFIAGRMLAGSVTPFAAAFFRFVFASGFLFVIVMRRKEKIVPGDRWQLLSVILLGMTGVFAYNALFFNGLKLVTAGRASIIIANNPIVISVLAALFFRETLSPVKIAGILISVSGAVVAISGGHPLALFSGGFGVGEFMIFGCVLSWAAYTLLGKRVMSTLSPLTATLNAAVVGVLALVIPACLEGMPGAAPGYTLTDWISLAYLGLFGTVLGFVWYYEAVRAIGPSRASLFINFVPISAICLGHMILDEPLTPSLLVGAILVVSGVTLNHLPTAGMPRLGSRQAT
ncbi:membrane protein [Desulfosarcina ovata subsp. sediminis]|uniref:Membrane protein n=1 Tax=Desulfosarcina ovata subsp. sediminis TaxID=885957 RepID=A0A5K7ZP39_9BACT|nr:DMT family transporter [Desulfosarcina ovata]BBO82495.1 membrane protein [Desulfosarcina ovata subsp. sediminis]